MYDHAALFRMYAGLYGQNGIRPANWSYSDYSAEFGMYAKDIVSAAGSRRIQGAAVCCKEFLPYMPQYVKEFTQPSPSVLGSLSIHHYPLSACQGLAGVNMSQLLKDSSTIGVALSLQPLIAATLAADIPFCLGETNTCSCHGAPNVSDVFGSALWVADYAASMASVGASRLNFHGL